MDKNKEQIITSGLYLVSTPIGNLGDITNRALKVLQTSDVILCEDTRRSIKLFSHFKIKGKLLAYHKYNEKKMSNEIISLIKKNKIISLISDAGTPAISDPGVVIINKCIEEGIDIHPVPGASAVTSAISVSGFKDKYLFYGFLPKNQNELNKIFKSFRDLDYSLVFFIPASKVKFYINEFSKFFSDRKILIAKEMTKLHQEFIRGKIKSIKDSHMPVKGELTVVISEKNKGKNVKKEIDESVKMEIIKMLKKYSHKDVVEYFSKKEGIPKKLVYDFCLEIKK